jgi:hypothetical protein
LTRHPGTRFILALSHTIQQIDEKVAELERMKRALQTLVHSCRDGATLDCPIIEALDK